jgi:cobalt-zinc-cadmium resistance protein CzcA
MVRGLISWAVHNPLIVVLLALALAAFGSYAFFTVNVEAYPDPAPAIIEVVAQYPGASAEEVERLVTIPLEVALAGMPNLTYTRSKSLAGLCHLRNQFEYGYDYFAARQEVVNRLAFVTGLPTGVNPQISPFTPTGELVRYTVESPTDASGREVYTLRDLKSLQDYNLDREFRRIARIAGLTSFGGEVKRYEVHPDPEQLKRYGISLSQLQNAISNSNANVGAGYLVQGGTAMNVRGIGLLGRGQDPMQKSMLMSRPRSAALYLRQEEQERLDDIRDIVVSSVNNVPVRVRDLVVKGARGDGVVMGYQPRLGRVSVSRPRKDEHGEFVLDNNGNHVWDDQLDTVQGIVLMRKNEATLKALGGVKEKIDELNRNWYAITDQTLTFLRKEVGLPEAVVKKLEPLKNREFNTQEDFKKELEKLLTADEIKQHQSVIVNEAYRTSGKLLPGTRLALHFDLTGMLHLTTETVRENLFLGMVLVTVILLMFLSNVRSALIVAVNVPLALLFAFSVLFLRGKSANLLSIGAVDFGIIVDSSVIMVENIYRHISAGENSHLPLRQRIILACAEVEKPLFFSTLIMVCAFIPLFTMKGPEGQIFGPMADTYAFALGGALLLALLVAPALCLIFFKNLQPRPDNFLVRWLKRRYLRQLERCLDYRWLTLTLFLILGAITVAALTFLGKEFMPELEEGNLYVRGTFPVNISLEAVADRATTARAIIRKYPEVAVVASQVGRPDDGTDPSGFYNAEFSIPLREESEWPAVVERTGWRGWLARNGPSWLIAAKRPRTKPELTKAMNDDLDRLIPGVDWNFSQYIRDNVTESLSGVKGDNSVKIIGPDLDVLEQLAEQAKAILDKVPGVKNAGVFRIKGQPNLEFRVDRQKCKRWNVTVKDVETAIQTAVGGAAFTQVVEGERTFDIALRWPAHLRGNEQAILDIPVDITGNTATATSQPTIQATNAFGTAGGVSPTTTIKPLPALPGSQLGGTYNYQAATPRLLVRHLVTPVNAAGDLDPDGSYLRPGASTIYREQGKRLIAIKFSVDNEVRDLAGAVAEAQEKVNPLLPLGYKAEWSGEFQQMKEAQYRLMLYVPLSLVLIFVLLYISFRNLLDALVVFSNVLALSLGGIWALLLTGHHLSISAAVGFISIFGVAIMDGLLLISYFNHMRAEGLPVRAAIMQGAEKRVRPVMMTALTAIFGLLPAAFSTRIGAQTQRPLAIVVVGGMLSTLFLTRYLMPVLYSFYGHREPPEGAGRMAH